MTRWMFTACVTVVILSSLLCPVVDASIGENLYPYIYCMNECSHQSCSLDGPVNKLLKWTCHDECKYNCMWQTVETLQSRTIPIPQFYGKWPFVRCLYMQEIASVVFSAFNLISQVYALLEFLKNTAKNNIYSKLWTFYGLVSINTWIWSMAFHSRDLPLTEKLDYISAFGVVLFFLVILAYRSIHHWPVSFNVFGGLCLLFYFNHASYIIMYNFDYGYNMKVNILVGSVAAIGWLMWSWKHRHLQHIHYMAKFIILTCATTILELLDFQPIFWLFDAHALWHLSTIPLHILLFRFAIADCAYMIKERKE